MFFSRWCYITSFEFLLPELPLAIFENWHFPSSTASLSDVFPGALIVTACAFGVGGALPLLVSLLGTLGWWVSPPCLGSPALQAAAVAEQVGRMG